MKIYIATKWENKPHARNVREALEALNHVVTSRWLDTGDEDGNPAFAALRDVQDVYCADVVLILQDGYDVENGCGMWIEFGMAVAFNKTVVVASQTKTKRSVFHSLPGVFIVSSFLDFFNKEEKHK